MWAPEQEKAAEKLLARLRVKPLAKEREKFGKKMQEKNIITSNMHEPIEL